MKRVFHVCGHWRLRPVRLEESLGPTRSTQSPSARPRLDDGGGGGHRCLACLVGCLAVAAFQGAVAVVGAYQTVGDVEPLMHPSAAMRLWWRLTH